MRPSEDGFRVGAFQEGDHPLQGLPHRTGPKGVLEPVDERIADATMGSPGSLAGFGAMVERQCEHLKAVVGLAEQGSELDRRVEAMLDVAGATPDVAKAGIKKALGSTMTHEQIERFFEAFGRFVESNPSRSHGGADPVPSLGRLGR